MTDVPSEQPAAHGRPRRHREAADAAAPARSLGPRVPARRVDPLVRNRPLELVAAHAAARSVAAVVAIVLSLASAGCGARTQTATQPSTSAPLGRPIGAGSHADDVGGRSARAAAQAFLTSYLAVSYGRARPDALRSASAALRERLRAQAPRVPPGVRHRRPRLIALRLQPAGDGRLRATATVDDADIAPYPLFATLARRAGGRWVAVSVGG
jgi:hypothetical protein